MDTDDAGSDASDASALFSLLYVSEMSAPDAHEVRRICEQSRANNLRDHITGLLVFDGHAFCQFVEGRERVIAALLARLEGDPRHRHMRLLVRVHTDCHRPPGHIASPSSIGDRPGQGCVGQGHARFYQVTSQSTTRRRETCRFEGKQTPPAWLRVIPPPRRTLQPTPDGAGTSHATQPG